MTPTYRDLVVEGIPVLVLGGDAAALVQVRALLDAGAVVTCCAGELVDALHDLADRGLVRHTTVAAGTDAGESPRLVVVTDPALAPAAREHGVPVRDVRPATSPAPAGSAAWTTGAAGGPAEARRPGRVTLVGGGPGDPGLLTRRGYEALAAADVVVADRLAPLAALEGLACEVIDVAKVPRGRFTPQERINAILVEQALAGRDVVRFKGGDSYVFGRGMEELVACREVGIEVDVVPGVTSAVSVPELAGIPVTHRGVVQGFTVVSGHAAPGDPRSTVDWAALATGGTTLVVLMGVETLPAIARAVLAAGRDGATPLACVMDGGLPSQSVIVTTLADVADHGAPDGVRAPAVTVIGDVAAFAR